MVLTFSIVYVKERYSCGVQGTSAENDRYGLLPKDWNDSACRWWSARTDGCVLRPKSRCIHDIHVSRRIIQRLPNFTLHCFCPDVQKQRFSRTHRHTKKTENMNPYLFHRKKNTTISSPRNLRGKVADTASKKRCTDKAISSSSICQGRCRCSNVIEVDNMQAVGEACLL